MDRKDLKQEFQKETSLSFQGIPINGVHLEYINWLEKRIEALSLHNIVGQSEQIFCDERYTLLAKVNSFVKNDKKESSETISKLSHNSSNIKYFQGREDVSKEIIKLLSGYFR